MITIKVLFIGTNGSEFIGTNGSEQTVQIQIKLLLRSSLISIYTVCCLMFHMHTSVVRTIMVFSLGVPIWNT